MKLIYTLFLSLAIGTLTAQDYTTKVNNHVYIFDELPADIGQGKANRLVKVIDNYLTAVVNDDFDLWMEQISDSTKARVITEKFPRKFNRVKEYKISQLDTVYIETFTLSPSLMTNEAGDLYDLVLEFQYPLYTANRVSFDLLKRKKKVDMAKYKMGVNIANTDSKIFKFFLHKYVDSDKKKKK